MDTTCLAGTGSNIFLAAITAAIIIIAAFLILLSRRRHIFIGFGVILLFAAMHMGYGSQALAARSCQQSKPSAVVALSPSPSPSPSVSTSPEPVQSPPPAPVITAPVMSLTTADNTPDISGTGVNGASVRVYDEANNTLCVATVQNGIWECTSSTLTNGLHTLWATQTGNGGKTSQASIPLEITIDTQAPQPVEIIAPSASAQMGSNTPTFSGTGEPGAMIDLEIHSDQVIHGSVTVDAAGRWTYTPSIQLTDGVHTVTVIQTDKAGNVSEPKVIIFTVDTIPPEVTVEQKHDQPDPTATNSIWYTIRFSEPIVDGTLAANDVVIGTSPASFDVFVASLIKVDNTIWKLEVRGMANSTTVTAALVSGAVLDKAGHNSNASTSIDNSVLYRVGPPGVSSLTTNDPTPALSGDCEASHGLELTLSSAAGAYQTTCDTTGHWNFTIPDALGDGSYQIVIKDTTANVSGVEGVLTIDTTKPSVTLNQAADQADPTNGNSARFTITFDELIDTASFTVDDLALEGTGNIVSLTQQSPVVWEATVGDMTSGTAVQLSLPAGRVYDRAVNANMASTATDNSVSFDATGPSVTVNQASGQADPTTAANAQFTVTFSESIDESSFVSTDLTLIGTSATITSVSKNSPTVWQVTIDGMTSGDTATLSLGAGMVTDILGNPNTASTATDNSVTYQEIVVPPTFCGQQAPWTCVTTEGNTYGAKSLTVPAAQMFVNSGLYLDAGETATITETGTWSANEQDGNAHGPCHIGDLIARIGLTFQSTNFTCVNGTTTFTASSSGILYLGALTGTDLGDFYGNRYPATGEKTVTITSSGKTVPTIPAGDAATYDFSSVASGWVEIWGAHVILTLPTDIAQMDAATIKNATDRLDNIYNYHSEVQPKVPYKGQRIRFFEDGASIPGAYMVAGNPIRMQSGLINSSDPKERITRAGEQDSYNWGLAHELAHDFTVPARQWIYMTGNTLEVWPNTLSCHAFERLGRTTPETHEGWYERCYDIVAGNNQYNGGSWDAGEGLKFLMQFKHAYGWDFYKSVFHDLLSYESNGAFPPGNPWYTEHDIFEAAAGEDITPVFESWGVPHP